MFLKTSEMVVGDGGFVPGYVTLEFRLSWKKPLGSSVFR